MNRLPTWRELNNYASPEEEERELEFWRNTPFWKKLEIASEMTRIERMQLMASLQQQYSTATPEELRYRFVAALYGEELATKVFDYLSKREKG